MWKKFILFLVSTKFGKWLLLKKFHIKKTHAISLPQFNNYYTYGYHILYNEMEVFNAKYPFTDFGDINLLEPNIQREINKMAWLSNLRIIRTDIARNRALFLVISWINHNSNINIRNDFTVISDRVFNLIVNYSMFKNNNKRASKDKILNSIENQIAYIEFFYRYSLNADKLPILRTLIFYYVFTQTNELNIKNIFRSFIDNVRKHILNDGGHVSRDPAITLNYLEQLLYVYYLLKDNPDFNCDILVEYIGRIAVFIRSIKNSDETLPLFNSTYSEDKDKIKYLLSLSTTSSSNSIMLRNSGYTSLKTKNVSLVLDNGLLTTKNSTLAMELCLDNQKIIGSLGGINNSNPRLSYSCLVLKINNKYYKFSAQDTNCRIKSRSDEAWEVITLIYSIEEYKIEYIKEIHLSKVDLSYVLGEEMLIIKGPKEKILPLINEAFLRFHFQPQVRNMEVCKDNYVAIFDVYGEDYRFTSFDNKFSIEENSYRGTRYTSDYCYTLDVPFDLTQSIIKNEWNLSKVKDMGKLINENKK